MKRTKNKFLKYLPVGEEADVVSLLFDLANRVFSFSLEFVIEPAEPDSTKQNNCQLTPIIAIQNFTSSALLQNKNRLF